MLGRLRFRLLRLGLLFAAQGTSERPNELLTSKPVGHDSLERTANPLLILTNQINPGLCLAHAPPAFQRWLSPDVAPLEPAIGKVLHRIVNYVLNVPETTHIVLKRGRNRHKHHTLYGFQLLCCIVHSVFLPDSTVTKNSATETAFADRPRANATLTIRVVVLNPTGVKSHQIQQLHRAL